MKRRGQAAMEFLMTYGWAILAAIIAIGVLAYFGVFTPGQFIGSSTIVTAPFYAESWNVIDATAGDTANIEVRNNGGESVTVQAVTLTNLDGATTCTALSIQDPIPAGQTQTYNLACTGMTAGETFKADITITYKRGTGSLDLTSTGSITDTIVAG